MKMTEKKFSEKIKAAISEIGGSCQSLEQLGGAVPDLLTINRLGHVKIIELKVVDDIHEKIPYQPGQFSWLRLWAQKGGNAYIVISIRKTNCFAYRKFEAKELSENVNKQIFRICDIMDPIKGIESLIFRLGFY